MKCAIPAVVPKHTKCSCGGQCLLSSWPSVWATRDSSQSRGDSAHTAASSRYLSGNDMGRVLLIRGQITALTKVRFKDCSVEFPLIMWLLNNNPGKHWCNLAIYQQTSCLLPSQMVCVPRSLEDSTMEKGKETRALILYFNLINILLQLWVLKLFL